MMGEIIGMDLIEEREEWQYGVCTRESERDIALLLLKKKC